MPSETIKIITTGGSFDAYLARPDGSAKAPGLVVLQEIFGVNEHIRSVCDRYAEEGYNAIAPEIFWRLKRELNSGMTRRGFATGASWPRDAMLDSR